MRAPRLVRQRDTHNAVYALTYSPDGERLAIGGGFYYGAGFVSFDDDGDEWEYVGHNLHAPTVSALAFDSTGRYLAAARWAATHTWAPALVFDLEGARSPEKPGPLPRAPSVPPRELGESEQWHQRNGHARRYATGVALCDGTLMVRRSAATIDDSITWFELTGGVRATPRPGLTSARMIDIGAAVVTGVGPRIIGAASGRVTSLAISPADRTVTAVTAPARGGGLTTCHEDGTISLWRVGGAGGEPLTIGVERTWAGHQSSVTAACHLAIDDLLVTADASGEVRLWRDDRAIAAWRVPDEVSVRALAAHPHMPRVAAGGKRGGPRPGYYGVWDVLV